jgi:RNA-directed DNA polymerase
MSNHIDKTLKTGTLIYPQSWSDFDWKKVNKTVKYLRGKIFSAKKKGDIKELRRFQGLLLKSGSNFALSIRKVTSINKGKNTPGIDKLLVKTNEGRWALYQELTAMSRDDMLAEAKPVSRIYVPKPNGKLRPIGIPTIKDRVIQNVVKNALEPEWEASFESSSYGFRPGRSAQDALARVWLAVARQKKKLWILDADIRGCFDNIDHTKLMESIGSFPARDLIAVWLKAGYIEFANSEFFETSKGTPQGGIISPLLANIALHGIEKLLGIKTVSTTGQNYGSNTYNYVRYADDFIVFAASKELCEAARDKLIPWLAERGLEFAPEKLFIRHLSEGIKFLGCFVKLYGKRDPTVLISPHKESVVKIRAKLKEIWLKNCSTAPAKVIALLNPVIRGWANYHKQWSASTVFSGLDHWQYYRSWRYSTRRHPSKGGKWIMKKYFTSETLGKSRWNFFGELKGKEKLILLKFQNFNIKRHVIVKNNMVPDDPSKEACDYWDRRNALKAASHWDNYESRLKVSKKQFHICPICYESLYNGEDLHLHHKLSKKAGGTDSYTNLALLHMFCHLQVHSQKLSFEELDQRIKVLVSNLKASLKKKKQENE